MNEEELRLLFRRVVAQTPYDGVACPSERLIEAYSIGVLPDPAARQLRSHLATCEECSALHEQMVSDAAWFLSRRDRILCGLKALAAREGLEPWRSCPPREALEALRDGRVSDNERREPALRLFREHLAVCNDCQETLRYDPRYGSGARIQLEIPWHELPRLAQATIEGVVTTIQEVAASAGSLCPRSASPGLTAPPQLITGVLLTEDCELVCTTDGHPVTVTARVCHAHVAADGRLRVEMEVPHFGQPQDPPARVGSMDLRVGHKGWELVVPVLNFMSEGRVLFGGEVAPRIPVPSIPWWMMRIVAYQSSS